MSHNYEPGKAARRHKPAIIAIVVALLVALAAFMVFRPGVDEGGDGIAMTPPPAGVTSTEVGGTDEGTAAPVSPDAGTPADGIGGESATPDVGTPAAPAN